jgi:hypothetical protein
LSVGIVWVWRGRGSGGREVGVAGEDDGEALRGEQRSEALGEGEGDGLLGEIGGDLASGIGASVGGIEEDEVEVEGGLRGGFVSGCAGFGLGGCGLAGNWDGELRCVGCHRQSEESGADWRAGETHWDGFAALVIVCDEGLETNCGLASPLGFLRKIFKTDTLGPDLGFRTDHEGVDEMLLLKAMSKSKSRFLRFAAE